MNKNKKVNSHKMNSFEISLLLSVLGSMCVYFLYNRLLLFYFNTRYNAPYFVCNSDYYTIIYFCVYVIFVVTYYFSGDRKMNSKKYCKIFSSIGAIILVLTFIFNTRVWVVTEQNISYNTLFTDKKICYEYSELNSATLYYNRFVGIKRGTSPEYTLYMNDGQNITLCLLEGYYNSYEDLIELDKKIANKRSTEGKYIFLPRISEEINTYYKNIFDNQAIINESKYTQQNIH